MTLNRISFTELSVCHFHQEHSISFNQSVDCGDFSVGPSKFQMTLKTQS